MLYSSTYSGGFGVHSETKEDADAFVDIEAVYDFGSYTYTIPKEELTKMAYVSSDGSIQISRSNVEAYVENLRRNSRLRILTVNLRRMIRRRFSCMAGIMAG